MTTTPEMGLELPTVGVTSGALGNQDYIDNFTILDTHDHSTGKGVQVPTAGLNINDDLSFTGFKAYNLGLSQYSNLSADPSAAANLPAVYVKAGELYFLDASSNVVQLTNLGSVAGTSGSIGGLSSPAAAQFSTNTFVWNTDGTTYAKMRHSDIELFPITSGATSFITLKASATATTYTITLPDAAPASTSYVAMSSGGALSTASADTIAAGMTSTGADAIGSVMGATGSNAIRNAMTRTSGTSASLGGIAISTSSGLFNTSSASFVAVTNLSVTIVTNGPPVYLAIQPDGGSTQSRFNVAGAPGTQIRGDYRFKRGSTALGRSFVSATLSSAIIDNMDFTTPPAYIDIVAAGTYTYTFEVLLNAGSGPFSVEKFKLVAFEIA